MPNAAPPRALFHLAYNVTDLDTARRFYGSVLGCREGRSTDTWVDFDFFGHQISLHLGEPFKTAPTGHVGDHLVPMPHLGLILQRADWQANSGRCFSVTRSATRLRSRVSRTWRACTRRSALFLNL